MVNMGGLLVGRQGEFHWEGSGRFIGLRRYVQIIAQRVYFESPFF